jgi:hypothetical protein
MASKSKSSGPKLTPPAAPTPQNEYYYQDGNLVSQRVFDPNKNGFIDTSFSTPDQQAIQKNSNQWINGLLGQAQSSFNMSPESLQAGVDAYTKPQYQALDNAYNQALGQTTSAANAGGMRNSVGFNDYLAKQLDKQKAQGYADIAAGGEQYRYQLPSMQLAPYMDAFNLANAAVNGQQAQTAQNLSYPFGGSQSSSGQAINNYQNQLNGFNSSLMGRLLYGNQSSGSSGLLGKLLPGF